LAVAAMTRYARTLVALCIALAGAARADDWSAWQRAYDPATRTRFIPVELWTGAPWDGTQEIRMAPAALNFGQRGDKNIKGPTIWTCGGTSRQRTPCEAYRFGAVLWRTLLKSVHSYAACLKNSLSGSSLPARETAFSRIIQRRK
jgi:hypothetical protein